METNFIFVADDIFRSLRVLVLSLSVGDNCRSSQTLFNRFIPNNETLGDLLKKMLYYLSEFVK